MSRVVVLLSVAFVFASAEFLTKKLCKNVDTSTCNIHNVLMDPCPGGPGFCNVKRNKQYTFTVDFTPHFSANKLDLAMYADDSNTGVYDKLIKTPQDACAMSICPVEAETRRIFDVDFSLDKTLGVSKFPVKVKMWNDANETQACCFTFNVKINK